MTDQEPKRAFIVPLRDIESLLRANGPMTTVQIWLKLEHRPNLADLADVNRLRGDLYHFWRTLSISFAGGKWWTVKQWVQHVKANAMPDDREEHFYA